MHFGTRVRMKKFSFPIENKRRYGHSYVHSRPSPDRFRLAMCTHVHLYGKKEFNRVVPIHRLGRSCIESYDTGTYEDRTEKVSILETIVVYLIEETIVLFVFLFTNFLIWSLLMHSCPCPR